MYKRKCSLEHAWVWFASQLDLCLKWAHYQARDIGYNTCKSSLSNYHYKIYKLWTSQSPSHHKYSNHISKSISNNTPHHHISYMKSSIPTSSPISLGKLFTSSFSSSILPLSTLKTLLCHVLILSPQALPYVLILLINVSSVYSLGV